jgi:hypothetical protein
MADIFMSYTNRDRNWAFWIGHELTDDGHEVHIHEWELPFGENILKWMELRFSQTDYVLCVVSGEYLTRPYSSEERLAAHWAAIGGRRRKEITLLPVFIEFVEDSDVPPFFAGLKRCTLYGLSEEEARKQVKTLLRLADKTRPRFLNAFAGRSSPRGDSSWDKFYRPNIPERVSFPSSSSLKDDCHSRDDCPRDSGSPPSIPEPPAQRRGFKITIGVIVAGIAAISLSVELHAPQQSSSPIELNSPQRSSSPIELIAPQQSPSLTCDVSMDFEEYLKCAN